MRVLVLCYEWPPLGGGTGTALLNLIKEFGKIKTLKIDVLSSSTGEYQEEKKTTNIKIIKLDIGKNNQNVHHQAGYNLLKYLVKSSWWIKKHKHDYDLIHVFGGLPGSITAFLSGRPYIVSLRGSDQPGYEPRFDKWLNFFKPILNIVYKKAKFVDANSLFLKKLTLKSFPKLKISVIKNGVNQKKFKPAKKPVNQPVVLCTSRFGARKGVKYLVKAIKRVKKEVSDVKLILIGRGEQETELKQITKDLGLTENIVFKGQVNREQMAKTYQQASLFVLPSLAESLANSLLEAMASGLPVIGTNSGGNPELIDKKSGYLVKPKDVTDLTRAMIKILKDKKLRIKMGQNSLKKIKSLTWTNAASKYLKIYLRERSS